MSLAEWGVPLPSPAWSAKKTTYMGQKTSTWFPIHIFTQELGPSAKLEEPQKTDLMSSEATLAQELQSHVHGVLLPWESC